MKKDKVEETGGELNSYPNDKYKKFFDKFKEIETLDISQWKIAHLLAYFSKKYKEAYNLNYSWKFNTPSPSKCFEVWQMNTLASKLSSNPKILKDYIDWGFENIVKRSKRRLTSISFMTSDPVVIDYKMKYLFSNKPPSISRTLDLPIEYKNILIDFNVNTYGDLAFIYQMSDMPDNIKLALNKLQDLGFDKSILDKIV